MGGIVGIVAIVVGIYVVFWLIGMFRHPVFYNQVDRVVLRSTMGEVELNEAEAKTLIKLYNASREAGEVTGEPGYSKYGCVIHLKDGTCLWISEGSHSKMILNPSNGERCYIEDRQLLGYMKELAIQYDIYWE